MKKFQFVNSIIIIIICFGVTYSLFHGYLFIWEPRLLELEKDDLFISDYDKLLKFKYDNYKLIDYIRNNTPHGSIFLVLRTSDFVYYAERKIIVHTDERFSDFYKLKNKEIAYSFLRGLNISYIYVPNYYLPTLYNSQLYRIVSDPSLCEIVYERNGYRLYKLIEINNGDFVEKTLFRFPQADGLHPIGWTRSVNEVSSLMEPAPAGGQIELASIAKEAMLFTGGGDQASPPSVFTGHVVKIREGTRHLFNADISGNGYLRVFLNVYFSDGEIKKILLWESVIQKNTFIESQFITPPGSQEYRLVFWLNRGGAITVRNVTIKEIAHRNDGIPDISRKLIQWSSKKIDFEGTMPLFDASLKHSSVRQKNGIAHFKQPDSNSYALYTGEGDILDPPSERLDFQWLNKSSLYRLRAFLKGKGRLRLFVWWYDHYGRAFNKLLDTYHLTSDFQPIAAKIRLPKNAVEFRIAFINTNDAPSSVKYSGFSEVYLRDAKLNNTMENDGPDNKFIWKTVYNSGSQNAGSDTVLPSTHSISEITDTKDFGWSTYSEGNAISLIARAVKRAFRSSGWSTYADGHEVSLPWAGVIMEETDGKPTYFLKQAKQKESYWLYTGLGQIHYPPSYSYDEQWRSKGKHLYRIQASVKGAGTAELYIWWYDLLGNAGDSHIGTYHLSSDYANITQTFELPEESAEYRIAFLLRKDPEAFPQDVIHKHPEIIISDVTIDRTEQTYDPIRPEKWQRLVYVDPESLSEGDNNNFVWGTYSGGRKVFWQWGLEKLGPEGKPAFLLEQADRKSDFWLYTGSGHLKDPPSASHDTLWRNKGKGFQRVQATIKGKGTVDLCVRWYDRSGNAKDVRIGSYRLDSDYKKLTQLFKLPEEAEEYRIAFILKKPVVKFSLSRSFLRDVLNYLLWKPAAIYISSFKIDEETPLRKTAQHDTLRGNDVYEMTAFGPHARVKDSLEPANNQL